MGTIELLGAFLSVSRKIGGRVFTALPQGGVDFVVGFELRRQDLSQNGDPILVADDALGFDTDTKFEAEENIKLNKREQPTDAV